MRSVVIVGASLAGLRAAETLRADGFEGSLTLVGEEFDAPYDRPPLSKELLTGAMAEDEVALPMREDLAAEWLLGHRATSLDLDARELVLDDGRRLPFDGLVIATGSAPRALPHLGNDPRIVTLRTLTDARRLKRRLGPRARVLIVGCGFIGVEVAASARAVGADVTVVALDPPLVPAGHVAGATARELLETNGVDLRLGRTVRDVVTAGGQLRALLDDGAVIEADLIIVAVGAVPCTDWLEGSGIELDNGVVCDAALRARGTAGVVAAGDVVRWPNPAFGGLLMRIEHWSNAVEQGVAAARSLLLGDEAPPFSSVPSFWSDHFGTRLQSIGLPGLADEFRVTAGVVEERRYAVAAYRDGELVGGVTYGMPKALIRLRAQLMRADAARA